jgi:hypothetical protein
MIWFGSFPFILIEYMISTPVSAAPFLGISFHQIKHFFQGGMVHVSGMVCLSALAATPNRPHL